MRHKCKHDHGCGCESHRHDDCHHPPQHSCDGPVIIRVVQGCNIPTSRDFHHGPALPPIVTEGHECEQYAILPVHPHVVDQPMTVVDMRLLQDGECHPIPAPTGTHNVTVVSTGRERSHPHCQHQRKRFYSYDG